jgi:acyl-CoA synthetase (AMP-forming)/AMP-acid ligase II
VRAATTEAFARKFARCGLRPEAIAPCYGLAEGTLLVTGNSPGWLPVQRDFDALRLEDNRAETATAAAPGDPRVRTLVSSGRPAPDCAPFICDPESDLRLPDGEIGEICIVGGSVAQGYWRRPEATAQSFRRSADGRYFRTGDLGFLLDGELFVTGRIKDLIIVNGVNHHPGDIESTVLRIDDAFRPDGSAAFAIELDGAERVVVVQEVERRALRRLDVADVCRAVRTALWEHHRLARPLIALTFGGTLPRTSSGKVRRQQCRSLFSPLLLRLAAGLPPTAADGSGLDKRIIAVEIDGEMVMDHVADTEVMEI